MQWIPTAERLPAVDDLKGQTTVLAEVRRLY